MKAVGVFLTLVAVLEANAQDLAPKAADVRRLPGGGPPPTAGGGGGPPPTAGGGGPSPTPGGGGGPPPTSCNPLTDANCPPPNYGTGPGNTVYSNGDCATHGGTCWRNIGDCDEYYADKCNAGINHFGPTPNPNGPGQINSKENEACDDQYKYLNTCCGCNPSPSPVPSPQPPTGDETCGQTDPAYGCHGSSDGNGCATNSLACKAACGIEPGDTTTATCSSQSLVCPPDQSCCSCTSNHFGQDPWMMGLKGQTFLFDGEDGKWYAYLHDSNMRVNMRIYEPNRSEAVTYVDGMSLVLGSADGEEHRIAVTIKDPRNFKPTCPKGEVCLGNGGLQIEIDGIDVSSPGYHFIDDGFWVGAYNAPWFCKLVPEAHSQWEDVELAMREKMMKNAGKGRRLDVLEPEIDLLGTLRTDVFDKDKCETWRQARANKHDLFAQKDKDATVLIVTPSFTARVEYTNSDEPMMMNNGRFELKEHQRLDTTMFGYKTPVNEKGEPLTSGVVGETAVVKHDEILGTPILKGRDLILSGADNDYEVKGPFSSEFKAKKRSDLRKLF